MDDRSDMRRRAAQQASYRNYWAGKCVGLIDEIEQLRTLVTERSGHQDPGHEPSCVVCGSVDGSKRCVTRTDTDDLASVMQAKTTSDTEEQRS